MVTVIVSKKHVWAVTAFISLGSRFSLWFLIRVQICLMQIADNGEGK